MIFALNEKRYGLLRNIIIGIISLLILLLSFKGHVIYYWDQGFIPYGTSNQLVDIFNLWIPQYGLGVLGGTINPFAIFIEIEYITSQFLPAWLSELLTIWIFYYLGGLGTMIFIEQILKFNEIKSIGKKISIIIPSILFYYGVPWWWFGGGLFNPIQWPDIVAEGLMPVLFIFTYKFFNKINSDKIDFKIISIIYVIFILLIYNFNVWNLILLLVYVPYFTYLLIMKIKNPKNFVFSSIIITFMGLSIYLALKPFIFLTTLYANNFVRLNIQTLNSSLKIYEQSSLPIFSVLISPVLSPIFGGFVKQPLFLFRYYQDILYLVISVIISILLFLPLLNRKCFIYRIYLVFLSILILIILNFWMGMYSPFFYLMKYLFIHVPVFVILKYPWIALDFVMPFVLTILFSSSIYIVTNQIKNLKRVYLSAILLTLISISYGFPVLVGYGIKTPIYFPNGPSPYLDNISSYNYISDIINSDNNLTTVLVLPPTYSLYTTKEYLGLDIYYWLLNNKNILDGGYLTNPSTYSLYWTFYSALLKHDKVLANNILSILNVKYIVLEGDALYIPSGTMPSFNISQIESGINILNTSFITSYSEIYLYEYKNPVGLFYSPKTFIISNLSSISIYLSNSSYDPRNNIIITPVNNIYNISPNQLSILEKMSVNIHRAKILDIEQYTHEDFCITVNSTGPFLLVFTQTFSPYWVVYANGSKISQNDHFIAYGFANVWFINESGVLKIRIAMPVQHLVQSDYIKYFGLSVSLLMVPYMGLIITRRIKNNVRHSK
ncbi:hypothetical protein EWF20_10400 [Sulfolobus sp. S-194]|uniref:hypothetical protein n=1 Tax=Sulfolobus sp. S-194 TaxID=2512240 RepID=UPI001436D309|nr:hypothetical protein [Sulfolobus sp. S-194]QIW24510.1 hypothetical protein EWF20_10400 [Sulfolobus sp. S-194]